MRSAKAPAIRAGVMIAKVIWKHMNTVSGIVSRQAVRSAGTGTDVAQDALQEGATKSADVWQQPAVKAML